MRMADLSGSGGGGGSASGGASSTGAAGGSGEGSGGEVAAHAANSSGENPTASCCNLRAILVTEANPENIDLRGAQTAAQHIQFVQIVGRANIHAMVISIVDLYALDVRLDTV